MHIDDNNKFYSESCNMYREFDTTYSNVQLEDKGILKFDAGYKLYENY